MKKAEPLYRDGRRVRADSLGNATGKSYSVSICGECGAEVAWSQSKAGKWFLVDTTRYTTEAGYEKFRALPFQPHFKTCGDNVRAQEEAQAMAATEENKRRWAEETMAIVDEFDARFAEDRKAYEDATPVDERLKFFPWLQQHDPVAAEEYLDRYQAVHYPS